MDGVDHHFGPDKTSREARFAAAGGHRTVLSGAFALDLFGVMLDPSAEGEVARRFTSPLALR
jgi:hypothetical protein